MEKVYITQEGKRDTYRVSFSEKGTSSYIIELDEEYSVENKHYCCPSMDIYGEESLESCIKALRVDLSLTNNYILIKGDNNE